MVNARSLSGARRRQADPRRRPRGWGRPPGAAAFVSCFGMNCLVIRAQVIMEPPDSVLGAGRTGGARTGRGSPDRPERADWNRPGGPP